MSRWRASIRTGLRGLLLRKGRSLLSTLGIVFGVAAVIAMMSIGEGARREALEQIKLLGTNNIRIRELPLPGELASEAERRGSKGLTYWDSVAIMETFPTWLEVAPTKLVGTEVWFDGRRGIGAVVGATPEYEDVTDFHVSEGRFITRFDLLDTKNVCVLGSEFKQQLFGYRDPLGAAVRIGETWFTVVGVMEPRVIREGKTTAIKIRRITRDVYIPLTTALRRFSEPGDTWRIHEIAVRATRQEDVGPIARAIAKLLRLRHRGVEDYEVLVPVELLIQAQQTQRIFNIVMGSIAGISLLVGGIGIMNIMLANVSERTREIGIRRAVGATKLDILAQFLVETVLICLVGGALGILLGVGIAYLVTRYAGWETAFAPASVLVAFGTSAAVGLVFGLFPARRAAQLDPVQALRFE